MKLAGKVAIITGAGQGIGASTARRMAQEGAKVVLAARRLNLLEEVVAEIVAAGGTAKAHACDISDEESVKLLVAATVAAYGKLDIVVNNAVLMVPIKMVISVNEKVSMQNCTPPVMPTCSTFFIRFHLTRLASNGNGPPLRPSHSIKHRPKTSEIPVPSAAPRTPISGAPNLPKIST